MTTPTAATSTPITERFALGALWIERYVLPWAFLYFAWGNFKFVLENFFVFRNKVHAHVDAASLSEFLVYITRYALLGVMLAFFGLTLFISRRPTHLPKKLVHVIVPLAMSYYFFLYGETHYLPDAWNRNLLPVEWRIPAAVLAMFLAIIGYGIAIWGILYLRRSFALMVAVRQVVSGGPYAYVRHPMYMGYIFELSGIVLASCSLAMLFLAVGFLSLMVYRARLEEERLVEACPAYREYMRRTGFLFPRLRRPDAAEAEARAKGGV